MTRGRSTASIVASPVLVGAVTTLIVIVSVFLAYNANTGLPFVPTYDLKVELPGGANLVPGNEVRIGGFRVGIIDKIGTGSGVYNGRQRAIAVVRMKIDKSAQPLSRDTGVLVRPRSALGLKYIQLTPGKSRQTFRDGDTIPLKNATAPVEFDDLLNTFDAQTRQNSQDALTGFGDAFAGRGQDVNDAIQGLAPLLQHLAPVMANLSNPATQLDEFFKQLGRTSAQIAPIAAINAQVFSEMADTFAAIGRNPGALQATIEKGPPTEDASIHSFRIQQPFLVDFADLSRRLRPAAQALVPALPRLNAALRVGTPVVRSSVTLNNETAGVFHALDDLVSDPNTLLGLQDLHGLLRVATPLVTYISPFQTVCNYATSFFNGLGSHISESTTNGALERILSKNGEDDVDDASSAGHGVGDFADRPADVPPNYDPTGLMTKPANPAATPERILRLQAQNYTPAVDAQGNADCARGQYGYPDGPLTDTKGRYSSANGSYDSDGTFNTWQRAHGGSGHLLLTSNPPFLYGKQFKGVENLRDVDPELKSHGIEP